MPVAALLYTWYSITRNAHDPQLKSDRVALQNTAVCRVNRTVLQHVYSKHLPAEQLTHSLILWSTAVDPARQATRKPRREQKTNTCSTGHRTLTIYAHVYFMGGFCLFSLISRRIHVHRSHKRSSSKNVDRGTSSGNSRRGLGAIRAVCRSWRAFITFFFRREWVRRFPGRSL